MIILPFTRNGGEHPRRRVDPGHTASPTRKNRIAETHSVVKMTNLFIICYSTVITGNRIHRILYRPTHSGLTDRKSSVFHLLPDLNYVFMISDIVLPQSALKMAMISKPFRKLRSCNSCFHSGCIWSCYRQDEER